MKSQSLLLLFLLCCSSSLLAQVMGNYEVQQRTQANNYEVSNFAPLYRGVPKAAVLEGNNIIEINLNALSNQEADSYTAIFNIIQVGKTASEANERINSRLKAIKSGLRSLGINDADIYIDMVNFLPKYEYEVNKKIFSKDSYTEVPTGFEIQKNIHIRYRKPDLLDGIITVTASQEVYDIVKVDYFIDKPQAVYSELRQKVFEYLDELVKRYAENNIPLDSAYRESAESAWVAYPGNRYESYQAFCSQRLPNSASNGNVTKADKPVSRFYNAVPANDYDIVINPNILEPAVQFSYNLKVRFTLPPRVLPAKIVLKEQQLILTPEGKLVRLKVEE